MWLLLATWLVLTGCTSTGSTPTRGPTNVAPPTTGAGSQPPSSAPTTTASVTLGPAEAARLVIRSITCDDVCGPQPGTTILSDGRVIWQVEGPDGWIMSERTLTPMGLQIVRDAMAATRLLDIDGSYTPTVRLGMNPPGHGTISHLLRAASDDRIVSVSAVDPGTFETDNEVFGDVWDIPAQAYVLSDLADKLSGPETWLPADAWADTRRPYEADAYLLVVGGERTQALPPFVDVDAVRWPFVAPIDRVGQPFAEQGVVVQGTRCLPITREVAAALAAAEHAIGYERSILAPYTDLPYAWKRGPGSVSVALRQLLPDQQVTCVGGGAW